jgi:hypothetical protein
LLSLGIALYCHAHLTDVSGGALRQLPDPVPAAQSLKSVTLGFDSLLADYYWLKFVSYIGDVHLNKQADRSKTEQFVDLIIALDPHFVSAYWFAAFTLGGDQRNPRKAAEILEFGIQNNPDNWYLPFIAGVNQYLYAGNAAAAASYYKVAAGYPGAPNWLSRQAQILESEMPKLLKDANSWLNIYRTSENGPVHEQSKEYSIGLWVQVYKTAPNDAYRDRAREVLRELGVDVGSLKKAE